MSQTLTQYLPASHDLNTARQALIAQGSTCVLCKGSVLYATTLRGVRPLVQWLQSGTNTTGFSAADKVVGKATAFLYCLLEVQEVYAHVMSRPALDVLQAHGIRVWYSTLVDHIVDRQGTGICPFEAAVLNIQSPAAALPAILTKMEALHIPRAEAPT